MAHTSLLAAVCYFCLNIILLICILMRGLKWCLTSRDDCAYI